MQSGPRNGRGGFGKEGAFRTQDARPSLSVSRGADISVARAEGEGEIGYPRRGGQGTLRLIVHGWAYRVLYLPDGRRFVRSFLMPGDLVGLALETWPRSIQQVVAATDVEYMQTDAEGAGLPPHEAERLRAKVAQAEIIEMALLAGLCLRLGKFSPYERVIHFFLETLERCRAEGLSADNRFWFPVPQEVLADNLGLSKVHLNRTLQALRHDRVIRYESNMIELMDVDSLMKRVNYEPLFSFSSKE